MSGVPFDCSCMGRAPGQTWNCLVHGRMSDYVGERIAELERGILARDQDETVYDLAARLKKVELLADNLRRERDHAHREVAELLARLDAQRDRP